MKDIIRHQIAMLLDHKDITCVAIPMHPLRMIEQVLEQRGFIREADGGPEINGREASFCYTFKCEDFGVTLILQGSLWQGNFRITKVD